MTISFRPGVAALALLPLAAIALQVQAADPANADAPVPPSAYVSAFAQYQIAAEGSATPDQTWRAANEAVREQDAHAAHQPAAKPDPHAGHHNMQGK